MRETIGDDIKYINDLPQTTSDGLKVIIDTKTQYAFFNAEVDPESKRYLSEDYLFCKRWIDKCGGEIWIDSHSTLTHTGTCSFKGNLMTHLKNNKFLINPITKTHGQIIAEGFK